MRKDIYQQIANENIKKTWKIITFFSLIVIALGFYLSDILKNNFVLYGFMAFSLISIWISYFYSDKMVLKTAKASLLKKGSKEYERIEPLVRKIINRAQLPMPKLYLLDEDGINAFATGRNPEHSAVAVTRGSLKLLNDRELSGVLAHEISHIKDRDILVMTITSSLVSILSFLVDFAIRSQNRDDNSGNILLTIISFIILPFLGTLIQAMISRKREYLADASGANLLDDPEGLAMALKKIAKYNLPMKYASTSTAHLYISNPFNSKSLMRKFFATHPPLEDRIKKLLQMKG